MGLSNQNKCGSSYCNNLSYTLHTSSNNNMNFWDQSFKVNLLKTLLNRLNSYMQNIHPMRVLEFKIIVNA